MSLKRVDERKTLLSATMPGKFQALHLRLNELLTDRLMLVQAPPPIPPEPAAPTAPQERSHLNRHERRRAAKLNRGSK